MDGAWTLGYGGVSLSFWFSFFFWFLVFGFFLGIQKLVVVDVIVTTVAITP